MQQLLTDGTVTVLTIVYATILKAEFGLFKQNDCITALVVVVVIGLTVTVTVGIVTVTIGADVTNWGRVPL